MVLSSSAFVKKKFAEYYQEESSTVLSPSLIERREFGFALFEGSMVRHEGFSGGAGLKTFLQTRVPSDAYFSCAYYEDPEAEMDRKGWLGADLIFDIDADHLASPCGRIHDNWTCGRCGFCGKGLVPEKCPVCGGEKFEVKTWPCVCNLQKMRRSRS
jgi:DNA primase small subunit